MDISNSTDTPSDGRAPIEAVAATAAESESRPADDEGSVTTATSQREEHRTPTDVQSEASSKRTGLVESKGEGGADNEKATPQGRSALGDLASSDNAPHFKGKLRKSWWQVYRPKNPPPPPPESLDDAKVLPLGQVNFLNELLYIWISPIIRLGKLRPLQATDLWKMDEPRTANVLAARFQKAYARRRKAAQEYNKRLDGGQVKPSLLRRAYWSASRGSTKEKRERWLRNKRRRANLVWCLSETVGLFFWGGGFSKVVGDMAQLCSPLVSKNLIQFAQAKANAEASGLPAPGIGRGIGDAFGLTLLIMMGSVFQHFFFYRSTASGCLLRAALSTTVYQKALTISNQARVTFSNGRLMANLSTDISRIDYATQWIHALWTAPIQIIVCAILLILQIGPSALVGLALFAALIPLQSKIMTWSVKVRKKSMVWTDARSRTLQEVLGSFAILKYFVFEQAYLKRISEIRVKELLGIRKLSLIKAANQALALSLPSLAAVVSFMVYTGIGNEIEPAKIFTSLSLFNLLRQPLMFLPRALSAAADATNALHRLEELLEAELRSDEDRVDPKLDVAVRAINATFQWTTASEDTSRGTEKKTKKSSRTKKMEGTTGDDNTKQQEPFKIISLDLEIPRRKLVAIVGSVGSGKSSMLSGLIGEMKQTTGTVKFGGKIAYCAQHAFIQNATLRDNVLFGQPWDEDRYWRVIEQACLVQDCLQLPDGDLTEIGERGINISGGQKQRVNVARALYYDADIILLDDPLSALDAHVGQAIFETLSEAVNRQGKTVVLVTHALHVLPRVDYIYTVDNGSVVEQGTYAELSDKKGAFAALMIEFGGQRSEETLDEIVSDDLDDIAAPDLEEVGSPERKGLQRRDTSAQSKAQAYDKSAAKLAAGTGKLEGRLVQQEKRNTGTIKGQVYKQYFTAGNGWLTVPLILASVLLTQGGQILTGLWLTYWENDSFNQTLGFYIGMYGMIGVTQAIFLFTMGGFVSLFTYFASVKLHARSMQKIFFAPMSFFHSTPTGRLMNVFGKDVDVLDSLLSDSLRMTIMILGTVFGSVIVIAVFFPYFLIAVGVIIFGYAYFWGLYRLSSRELKRMDSILRSLLYGHFSESLAGMSTIRAYGESNRFMAENARYMDLEDRAYFLTSVNSRWLAIRIDSLGAIMVLAVALMAANGVNGISPSQVALTLTYCVTMLQSFGMVTRQAAETENNMNAVERLTYYSSDTLPQEAPHEIPSKKPSKSWPEKGEIVLTEIEMAYRPELPSVLKKISLHIKPCEKVGICGRTGSGKSSIMAALFRMVELRSGSITIDGIDISTIGLDDLRAHMSIIPQDPQLFSGTIRSNLDPFSQYDDARLNDAMKRSYLLEDLDSPESTSQLNLDSPVEDGGENLSMGQQSLVALARALVRDCKIIVLDEASASLDLETDSKIQETITKEFHDRTLLCIAHRLRTVIGYDRILVLESGEVLEFDDPVTLYRKGGAFHAMCVRSSITEADIVKAQKQ